MLQTGVRGLQLLSRFSWACAHRAGVDLRARPCFIAQQRARDAPAHAPDQYHHRGEVRVTRVTEASSRRGG